MAAHAAAVVKKLAGPDDVGGFESQLAQLSTDEGVRARTAALLPAFVWGSRNRLTASWIKVPRRSRAWSSSYGSSWPADRPGLAPPPPRDECPDPRMVPLAVVDAPHAQPKRIVSGRRFSRDGTLYGDTRRDARPPLVNVAPDPQVQPVPPVRLVNCTETIGDLAALSLRFSRIAQTSSSITNGELWPAEPKVCKGNGLWVWLWLTACIESGLWPFRSLISLSFISTTIRELQNLNMSKQDWHPRTNRSDSLSMITVRTLYHTSDSPQRKSTTSCYAHKSFYTLTAKYLHGKVVFFSINPNDTGASCCQFHRRCSSSCQRKKIDDNNNNNCCSVTVCNLYSSMRSSRFCPGLPIKHRWLRCG